MKLNKGERWESKLTSFLRFSIMTEKRWKIFRCDYRCATKTMLCGASLLLVFTLQTSSDSIIIGEAPWKKLNLISWTASSRAQDAKDDNENLEVIWNGCQSVAAFFDRKQILTLRRTLNENRSRYKQYIKLHFYVFASCCKERGDWKRGIKREQTSRDGIRLITKRRKGKKIFFAALDELERKTYLMEPN